jgi:hypothetical protein
MNINLPIPIVKRIQNFILKYPIEKLFQGRIDDRVFMVQFFQQYVEDVRACVPADQLLVYSVTEGWEPLCEFLGIEVPDQPFPRVNTRGGFKDMVMKAVSGYTRG